MRRMVFATFLMILVVGKTLAAYPTMEGLFRNLDNQEITADWIVLKLMLKQIEDNRPPEKSLVAEQNEKDGEQELVLDVQPEKIQPAKYLTYIFSLQNEHRIQMLQILYGSRTMSNSSIESVHYISDLNQKINEETQDERSLFYSLLFTLVLNKSDGFVHFLRNNGIAFVSNKDMMNKDKIKLLGKYKKYLLAVKDDDQLRASTESPMQPENEEQKINVDEIMRSNMYKKSQNVTLVKGDGEFYWKIELQNFIGRFSNEKKLLRDISYMSDQGKIEIMIGNYILFNGVHQLPKVIVFKNRFKKLYKIRMLELKHFTRKKTLGIKQEAMRYKKILKVLQKKNPGLAKKLDFTDLFYIQ
ncbi:MAG: hypothetical protein KAQ98_01630 [Bacteriovoracaceae bacterium]|nr:hypothetical protein [Bacteriovoracaceae bacterium]